MNNDLNQNLNNNVTPQPMPNTEPVNPQPIPGPIQQPVAEPMSQEMVQPQPMPNPVPQEPVNPQQVNMDMGGQVPNQMPVEPQPMNTEMMKQPSAPMAPEKPPKQKSNPVLIILMIIALIGGAIYFGYNYFFANKTTTTKTTNSGTTDNTNEVMQNDEAVKIVKEVFLNQTVQYLTDFPSVTGCKTDNKTYTEEELGIDKKWNGYQKCTDYKSYEELSNYFKSFFTEEFYNTNIANKGTVPEKDSSGNYNYYEKDGELYAAITGKGGNTNKYKFLDEKSKYEITNLTAESISSTINAYWEDANGQEYSETIKTVLKKNNNKWLIDSYEKQE